MPSAPTTVLALADLQAAGWELDFSTGRAQHLGVLFQMECHDRTWHLPLFHVISALPPASDEPPPQASPRFDGSSVWQIPAFDAAGEWAAMHDAVQHVLARYASDAYPLHSETRSFCAEYEQLLRDKADFVDSMQRQGARELREFQEVVKLTQWQYETKMRSLEQQMKAAVQTFADTAAAFAPYGTHSVAGASSVCMVRHSTSPGRGGRGHGDVAEETFHPHRVRMQGSNKCSVVGDGNLCLRVRAHDTNTALWKLLLGDGRWRHRECPTVFEHVHTMSVRLTIRVGFCPGMLLLQL